jgi:small-conductance mechanosensitive channel
MELFTQEFAGNPIQSWAIALGAVVLVQSLLVLARGFVAHRLARLGEKTGSAALALAAKVARRTRWLFLLVVSLFPAAQLLELPDRAHGIVHAAIVVALIVQGGLWVSVLIRDYIDRYRSEHLASDPGGVTTVNVLHFISRIILWSLVVLLVLDNLGINVTALVTGLGIGGVAVALALQTVLGDLFASLSIALDKPFVIGDFLAVGDLLGSVEYVGLKTTRLRSLSGEQLVFSNSDLLGSRIRNYGRMYERRVPFAIGVTYQTPRDKLRKIPVILREAVEAQDHTRFDRSHFKEYGDFSLNFETVYYVSSPDYNLYMDIQQAINLHIHERFEAEGIEFAYPTQTVFVAGSAAAPALP